MRSLVNRRIAGIWAVRGGRYGVLALSADASRLATGADVFVSVIATATGAVGNRFHLGRLGTTFAEFSPLADRLAIVARPLDGAINIPVSASASSPSAKA